MVYGDLLKNPIERNKLLISEFGINEEEIPKRIAVTPMPIKLHTFPENFEKLLKDYGIKLIKVKSDDPILKKLGHNLILKKGNKTGMVLQLGRGAIEFADRIKLLSMVPQLEEILFLGSAASLCSSMPPNSFNVPKVCLVLEQVGFYFSDITKALPLANRKLVKEIKAIAKKHKAKVFSKLHATTPLFYIETQEFLMYLKAMNVCTLDMEVSTFFTISNFHNKKPVALLRVSDFPLHKAHFFSQEYQILKKKYKEKSLEIMLKVALEFMGLI